MARRKITLEEAFAVFEQHGLKVEVKAVQQDMPQADIADFLEHTEPQQPVAEQLSSKTVKITLHAAHTIGTAGSSVVQEDGSRGIENSGIQTYGPGIVTVPTDIAKQLLHQDMLARMSDDNLLTRTVKTRVIMPRVTPYGDVVNVAVPVSESSSFDLSSFLARLGDRSMFNM